ncbi:MAG: mechanosensitive ion channel family protein, partial [Candidatus Babeliales bacterium]
LKNSVEKKTSTHVALLQSNNFFYGFMGFILFSLVQECGFNISALLGAAGIVGIAIGFAAKTIMANILSGIFLLLERPFVVGDRIICAGATGIVQSIGLMAVTLRTIQGQSVRIPNETIASTVITNNSFYPQRCLIFKAEIPTGQNVGDVVSFLTNLVEHDNHIEQNPKPKVIVRRYGQYHVDIMLRLWIKQQYASDMLNHLHEKLDVHAQKTGLWIGLEQEL